MSILKRSSTVIATTAVFLSAGCLLSGKALALSISATVTGSRTPTQIPNAEFGDTIQNGDFLITRVGFETTLGNGSDEVTTWSFDFATDPNLSLFPTSGVLEEALLTLELSPRDPFITTDATGIPGGKTINIPDLPDIPAMGDVGTITIDLLEFGFTSEEILATLQGSAPNIFDVPNGPNILPWRYQDDAIISSAELTLHAEPVPEPSTLLGLGTLALASGTLLRRRQKA